MPVLERDSAHTMAHEFIEQLAITANHDARNTNDRGVVQEPGNYQKQQMSRCRSTARLH